MLAVLKYGCASHSKLNPARYAPIPIYRCKPGWFSNQPFALFRAHWKVAVKLPFSSVF
jgi:hypothetical protein